ncbi:hypothetical protein WR25_22956 [Diploscapter pachys]|uniref:Uncharacterized protein n=1 Tax=Diploscapter pachys TaxID=2018661 RepID=A0A2A2K3V3_9BILA|nr:hypothetical protein WR25_22956 [Diploscapter pachys]
MSRMRATIASIVSRRSIASCTAARIAGGSASMVERAMALVPGAVPADALDRQLAGRDIAAVGEYARDGIGTQRLGMDQPGSPQPQQLLGYVARGDAMAQAAQLQPGRGSRGGRWGVRAAGSFGAHPALDQHAQIFLRRVVLLRQAADMPFEALDRGDDLGQLGVERVAGRRLDQLGLGDLQPAFMVAQLILDSLVAGVALAPVAGEFGIDARAFGARVLAHRGEGAVDAVLLDDRVRLGDELRLQPQHRAADHHRREKDRDLPADGPNLKPRQ